MSETIITVQGEHEERRRAEHGTVRIQVTYDGPDRQETLAHATARHAELVAGLREIQEAPGSPVLRWSSGQLRVWGDRPWSQSGEQLPIVHHAQITLEAEFSDTNTLSDWVGTISLRDGVMVEGVSWSLSDETRLALADEVSRRAIADAVGKATRFATALGLSALRPIAVSDPGMLGDAGAPPQPLALHAARMVASDATSMPLALEPDEIPVIVQVHARFAAS
jgi:uncharacterized protein YggE